MRGLPGSGKSHTARKLAGEAGLVCETDEYFYTQTGKDPRRYDYRPELLEEARRWNFGRFKKGVDEGITPIVVDRGNALTEDTRIYAQFALDRGYRVEIKEPDSEWWQEIRILLKYKQYVWPVLRRWANILARMSRANHRVPEEVILRRMRSWKFNLTVDDILRYRAPEGSSNKTSVTDFEKPIQDGKVENGSWLEGFVVDLVDDASDKHPNNRIVVDLSQANTRTASIDGMRKGKSRKV